MGLCGSSEPRDVADVAIEKDLRKDRTKFEQQVRVLLLGPGESGKSTVFKQMIINYGSGFSDEERASLVPIAAQNILASMQTLLQNESELLALNPDAKLDPRLSEQISLIKSLPAQRLDFLSDSKIVDAVEAIWKDEGFQRMLKFASRYHVPEAFEHFTPKVRELVKSSYRPTNEDILKMRNRTTGILETEFEMEKSKFKIVDVGGQRSERKKWIKVFNDVNAILFVAAIGEYDQTVWEDRTSNRIHEALDVFEDVVNHPIFKGITFIVFMNKVDVFEKKFASGVPLSSCFPDWKEGNLEAAYTMFESKFRQRSRDPSKEIYFHRTTATNADNIMKIWSIVSITILRSKLRENGLM